MVPQTAQPAAVLNTRAAGADSSAVRDLLAQAARPDMLSLAGGLPDAALFPLQELADLTAALLRTDGRRVLQYGRTEGTDEARQALANRFGFTDPSRVLITTGSQQGLDLLLRVIAEPGDEVVVGDPEYLGFLQVLSANGCRPVPIPIDGEGLDVDALADALAAGLRPKACYLVRHFHNPTGVTMSPDRRVRLAELSNRYGFVLIDDDPYRNLYHAGRAAPASDSDSDPDRVNDEDEALTVRLRTMSKSLAPGLRVAVVEAPPPICDAMVIAKQSCDLHTSTLSQAMVTAAISSPWFPAHLDRLRESYRSKCATLIGALEETFGSQVRVNRPTGGMFVWADFGAVDAPSIDTGRWLTDAVEHGVCFVPGQAFAVEADLRNCVRFSFATVAKDRLAEAVARLAASFPISTGSVGTRNS